MADAQYVIDVAANMAGGETTTSELDALTQNLMGAGKGADFFQQAIKKLSGDLTAAQAVTAAANAELAKGQEMYANLETAALQASKAAEKAAAKNGGVVPDDLLAKAKEANAAVNAYADTLKDLEKKSKDATASEDKLGQTLTNVKKLSGHVDKSLAAQAEGLEKLGGALGAVGGPVGTLGQQIIRPIQGFKKLSAGIGETNAAALLGTAAFVGLAAAIVAIGIAAAGAVIKVAAWAVGLSDSARSANLSREALNAMHPELAALSGEFGDLHKETGLAESDLVGIAKQLTAAKVSAEDMPGALRAAALAEKALGKGGASEFVAQIQKGEQAVSDLANETSAKLGGIVARQMLSLESQGDRLRSNIGEIFGGLNIQPVLDGLQTLVKLFDKNEAAGKAIKFLFETIFQPLIDQAQTAAYVVEAFALGFLIGLTKVYIAIKPAIKAISEFFGFDDSSLTDLLSLATDAGKIAAYIFVGFVAVLGTLVAAITAVVGAVGLMVAGFVAIPAAIISAINAVATVIGEAIANIISYFRDTPWTQIGTDIVMGLANGITNAGSAVLNAITGVVGSAIGAAKSLLGISSPSKVFEQIGQFTGEGFTGGVEGENDNAQSALTSMVSPAAATAEAATAPAAAATAKGSGRVDLSGAVFNFYGVKDAEHAQGMLEESLTRILEGDAASLGANPEAA